tara:strand:- start:144 stop:500 length:357 start_codon:yes stop_codon:yes gene_type:complete
MYGRSKLANIMFASALNKRFGGTNRKANSVHPGVIRTNLARHVENADEMFENIKKRVRLKSVGQGAATQCLVATHPDLASVGGEYFSDCAIAKTAKVALDTVQEQELWRITEELIAQN